MSVVTGQEQLAATSEQQEVRLQTSFRRSCHACNLRKVRCDKKKPCSHCIRANETCTYPTSASRGRKSKDSTIVELRDRVALLEKALKRNKPDRNCSRLITPTSQSRRAKARDLCTSVTSIGEDCCTDKITIREESLLQQEHPDQYISDVLLSTVMKGVSKSSFQESHCYTYLTEL